MFFILSKILGFFAAPSNLFISIGVLGLLLLLTRFTRLASWLVVTSLVLLAIAGLSPLGNALILPLEDRFLPWDPSRGAPNGIVVLGGAISPGVSDARDSVALDEAAERITATAELARRYPDARIIFSGGSGSLLERDGPEAPFAVRELLALGVAHDRITAEEQSRNTIENAAYSRLLANPKPGAVDFPVEAYPVDWRTRGWVDLQRGFPTLSEGLRRTDAATREWVGLIVYRLTGVSAQLLPGP